MASLPSIHAISYLLVFLRGGQFVDNLSITASVYQSVMDKTPKPW